MEAYQCDESGFFVGVIECQRNPIKIGQFLLPRNATYTHKPEECNWYNFDSGEWQIKETYEEKIEKGYNTNTIEVVIEGSPSKEQIKIAISQLMNML